MPDQFFQILLINLFSLCIIVASSQIFTCCKRKFCHFSIDICFYFFLNFFFQLMPFAIDYFNSIVRIRVVAGSYHDAKIKCLFPNQIRNTWRRRHMYLINIRPARSKSCRQRSFVHITGKPCVLAYNYTDSVFSVLKKISKKPSDFVSMVRSQSNICLSPETICTKIFHDIPPCKSPSGHSSPPKIRYI